MTWGRLDDVAPLHPKQLRAGPEACWLWAAGLAWHGRNKKLRGRIPKDVIGSLYPHPTWTTRKLAALAAVLVQVGLWEDIGDSFQIHDIDDYQPGGNGGHESAEPLTAAERAKAYRERKRHDDRHEPRDAGSDASRDASCDAGSDASRDSDRDASRHVTPRARARAHPVPSRPDPSLSEGASVMGGFEPGLDPLDADPRPVARGVDAARTAAGLAPSFPGGTVGMADQRRIGEAWARIVAGAAHHGVSVEEFCRRSFGAFLERSPGRGVAVWLTDPCAPLDDAAGQEPPAAPKSDLVLAYERARDAVDHGRARGYGPEKMRELEDIERAARKAKNTRQPKGATAT